MLAGYFATDSDQGVLELYADQLVRRADPQKRSLKQFFEDEFAKKSSKWKKYLEVEFWQLILPFIWSMF